MVLFDDFAHPGCDLLDVLRSERSRHFEIVVEAVFDCRAETDVRLGKQFTYGGGQDVCRGVTQHFERERIGLGDDLHSRVVRDRTVEIPDLAIDAGHDGSLGEARTSRFSDCTGRCPNGHLSDRPVG